MLLSSTTFSWLRPMSRLSFSFSFVMPLSFIWKVSAICHHHLFTQLVFPLRYCLILVAMRCDMARF